MTALLSGPSCKCCVALLLTLAQHARYPQRVPSCKITPKTTAGREDMELLGVKLNGSDLSAEQYERRPRSLTIPATVLPEGGFELEVRRQCS